MTRTIGEDLRELVVLVDRSDAPLGVAPKLDVHRDGRLHRAVSVVLFDDRRRVLMQRRAPTKYHSGGLWSNTCCGHPMPGEPVLDAARRRLRVEMGIADCDLSPLTRFIYRAAVTRGLVEHELDHVVVGHWAGVPTPNPAEVSEARWMSLPSLRRDLEGNRRRYTAWLGRVLVHSCAYLP